MQNIPAVKLGLAAVSRDCFPVELSKRRRDNLLAACKRKNIPITKIETVIENETDVTAALSEMDKKNVNALTIFLGNFGPEGPTSLLAQKFPGPTMMIAAAEETSRDLINGRGDALCGLLSASYNMGLRRIHPYIPESPVGDAEELTGTLADFIVISRVVLGARNLKIFSFGPRPQDFYTCFTPIQPLFDLGVEVMENSELDLLDIVQAEENNPQIPEVAADMANELGAGNAYPGLLKKLAQYELALEKFLRQHLGASRFGAFANKCWPAFEKYFGHVPCYINSRLAARGIPVACEADVFGALSEYMALCASGLPPTLLDINNTVPKDLIEENRREIKKYQPRDLWMGFHCGNTCASCMVNGKMKYQLIMHRLMEPGQKPGITRGTLEGQIKPGPVTIFRLQGTPDNRLQAYAAEGEVLNIDPKSFGAVGVFAVGNMNRFYRHVLLEKRFPHHTAAAFSHVGKYLFPALKLMCVNRLYTNFPGEGYYPSENPFA